MSVRDIRGNNLLVGREVKDRRQDGHREKGIVRGSDHADSVIVDWGNGMPDEKVRGTDLELVKRGL